MKRNFWTFWLILGAIGSAIGGVYFVLTTLAFDAGAEMLKLKEAYVFFFGLLLVAVSLRKLREKKKNRWIKCSFKHLRPKCYQGRGKLLLT
ncbi:MAG: hypothetical protein WA055_03905 [Candidatus Moraniibacteriota bacterium]